MTKTKKINYKPKLDEDFLKQAATEQELDPRLATKADIEEIHTYIRNGSFGPAIQRGFATQPMELRRESAVFALYDTFLSTVYNKTTKARFFIQSHSNEDLQKNLARFDLTNCNVATTFGKFPQLDSLQYELD